MKNMVTRMTTYPIASTIIRWLPLLLLGMLLCAACGAAFGETVPFKPPHASLCLDIMSDETDGMRCDDRPAKPRPVSRPFLIVPGIYQNFDDAIGAEISVIRGIFGLALGLQDDSAGYLEGELVVGPISVGFGPRLKSGKLTPQTTIALPFFYIFPYWRWSSDDTAKNGRHQEFGVMLKIPLEFGAPNGIRGHIPGTVEEGTI